jgi:protein-L-isoaspartate(D-aspartate) O-methyltransferase
VTTDAEASAIKRERLAAFLRSRGIRDERVLRAIQAVPRERFVPPELRGKAYTDAALPIGEQQSISQPWIMARMSELTEPDGGGRVLEIGTGSGYQAAVLAGLFEQVYTVERIASLSRQARLLLRDLGIENVHFKIFDGTYGWGEFAPYRAILVTAGAPPEMPRPLFEQLEEGGRLVIPLSREGSRDEQSLTRIVKREGLALRTDFEACRFVPLVGRYGWES